MYDQKYLQDVLKDNGWTVKVWTPEWYNFALQILIVDNLDSLISWNKRIYKEIKK